MNRSWKDRADAVLVTGVISLSMLLLVMGITLDFSKNAKLKLDQDSHAQQASQVSVKHINARGSLDERAVAALVQEYAKQSGYAEITIPTKGGGTEKWKDEAVAFKSRPGCRQRDITLASGAQVNNAVLPYMVIKLDAERKLSTTAGTVTYQSNGLSYPTRVSGTLNPNIDYKVISLEVHDAVDNHMLDMFQVPCQDLTSRVSAIAFGSNEDLEKRN